MKAIGRRGARWAGIVAVALFVAACGGGGGSTPTPVTAAAPPADARNGSYTMYAADAHEYTLALDFDAKTYQLNGNGAAESGTFAQQGPAYVFPVGNASGATGQSTTRFVMGTEVPGNYSQSSFRVSPSIEGIRAIDPNQTGFYFTTRSSELAVVVASRGNPITPGLMAIGVKQ
jgi:hypothetical protein